MRKYGWIKDSIDKRDYLFKPIKIVKLPDKVDLRNNCPEVYDQEDLGSCTANAIAAHFDFNRNKQGEEFIYPSRLFIYYNNRLIENTVDYDSGATIRDSVKSVIKYGCCNEKDWPYIVEKFRDKPNEECYKKALDFQALTYQRIARNEKMMKSCLAEGYPFVCGISVYDSFEESENGNIPIPKENENLLGGHAIMIVGYENDNWICRNSWGKEWGDKGYFYLPIKYLLDNELSDDYWTLRKVE